MSAVMMLFGRAIALPPGPVSPLIDAPSVRRIVGDHARKIGCDDSNRHAAIAWAMRYGTCTLHACRIGMQRADTLRQRQDDTLPPVVA